MRLRPSLTFLFTLIMALACGSAMAQMAPKRAVGGANSTTGITGNDGGELVQDANGGSAVRYKVNHPVSLAVEHGTLTISRERIKFEATSGRGFDYARTDLSLAREWTGLERHAADPARAMGGQPEPLGDVVGVGAGHQRRDQLADQRGELRAVPRAR